MVARIDFVAVETKAASFPDGEWRRITGSALRAEGGVGRTWKELDHVRERGGRTDGYCALQYKSVFSKTPLKTQPRTLGSLRQ